MRHITYRELPRHTPLPEQAGEQDTCGRDSVSASYTVTAINGQEARLALERLSTSPTPWSLTANFNAPHPPMVTSSEYLERYYDRRDELLVQPSIDDPMVDSASHKFQRRGADRGYSNATQMSEMTAAYYGLVEEFDYWVGELVDELEDQGRVDSTLIVFSSDHGEKLGSHGQIGKGALLEEDRRVPLIIVYPPSIPPATTLREPVSHIDIFATILDYAGAPQLDQSDGKRGHYNARSCWLLLLLCAGNWIFALLLAHDIKEHLYYCHNYNGFTCTQLIKEHKSN